MSPNSPKGKKALKHSEGIAARMNIKAMSKRFASFVGRHLIDNLIAAILGGLIVYGFQEWRHPSPPSPVSRAPIEELIRKEADFARGAHSDETMKKYSDLFAPDAWVIDFGMQEKPWKGQAEIVDRVRPLHFNKLDHTPTQILISEDGSLAFAETKTVFEQDQPNKLIRSDTEFWQFGKLNGAWKIRSFEVGHPP